MLRGFKLFPPKRKMRFSALVKSVTSFCLNIITYNMRKGYYNTAFSVTVSMKLVSEVKRSLVESRKSKESHPFGTSIVST